MRVAWLAIGLSLAASAAPQAPPSSGATPAEASATSPAAARPGAPKLEPYRFNARERTARALAAWEKGRAEEAVAPLDSALRLQPGNPLVEYNAGTAHLGANQPDAAELLEQAAKHAPADLVADTLVVESAHPHEAIIAAAKSKGSDLILMATHGRSGSSSDRAWAAGWLCYW